MSESVNYPFHEQLFFGGMLTMVAGSIDAYSYLFKGEVFSGLQTGNIILMGIHLGNSDILGSLRYMGSILSFGVGTMIVRFIQHQLHVRDRQRRQVIIAYQFILLLFIALISDSISPMVTTSLLSIAAASELQEFRRLKGSPFTPLMMTGNVRTVFENLYDGIKFHDLKYFYKIIDVVVVITTFLIGAALVSIVGHSYQKWSIIVPVFLSLISLILISFGGKRSV